MHPNELLARKEIELIQAGDWDAVDRLYTDDIVIHYPGRNPLAGSHSAEQFLAKFQTLLKDQHELCPRIFLDLVSYTNTHAARTRTGMHETGRDSNSFWARGRRGVLITGAWTRCKSRAVGDTATGVNAWSTAWTSQATGGVGLDHVLGTGRAAADS
jgi:hypothetical protein